MLLKVENSSAAWRFDDNYWC